MFNRNVTFQSVASENSLKSIVGPTVKKIIHFSVSDDKISWPVIHRISVGNLHVRGLL